MIKWTIRIFLILVAITVFTLFYLSFYGLETDYFNSTIQNKVKTINPNFDLEFQKTNILLDTSWYRCPNFEFKYDDKFDKIQQVEQIFRELEKK